MTILDFSLVVLTFNLKLLYRRHARPLGGKIMKHGSNSKMTSKCQNMRKSFRFQMKFNSVLSIDETENIYVL